jgi:hypothetical protein
MMFSKALNARRPWKFVLQDYNDIFNLVTVPNLFLTWYITQHPEGDEMSVTDSLKQQFLSTLKEIGIEFKFIVGAWCPLLLVTHPPALPRRTETARVFKSWGTLTIMIGSPGTI